MSSDPFKIDGPTCISFSGGRTSAYMLWRVLQSNGGLPAEAIVCFANTGKECEETLDFVQMCGDEWKVPIVWLEYENAEKPADRWKIVSFETASRNGEPFEKVINQSKFLPNPVARKCTIEMKIKPMEKYLKSIGMESAAMAIGIRADEQRRAAKMTDKFVPLIKAGVTREDVLNFWKSHPFDLGLPFSGSWSNCDLCFLKGRHQIMSLIIEKPSTAIWWAKMEEAGSTFRSDRPNYAQMLKFSEQQQNLFDPTEETIPCFCGD